MKKYKLKLILSTSLLISMSLDMVVVHALDTRANSKRNYIVSKVDEQKLYNESNNIYLSENLVRNSGFEQIEEINNSEWNGNVFPNEWIAKNYGGNYKSLSMNLVNDIKKEGMYSLKMETLEDNSRGFVNQTFIVKPNTNYELSADIKLENILPVMFGIQIFEKANGKYIDTDANRTTVIRADGTSEWANKKYIFKTGENTDSITIRINMGTNQGVKKGSKAWIDNISFKEVSIPVEAIRLSKNELKASVGTTHKLDATVIPQTATNKELIWESSDNNIVTVDEYGLVTLKATGAATIKVKSVDGEFEDRCEIIVVDKETIESIEMDKEVELELGSKCKLKPIIKPQIDGIKFNWSSNSDEIVTVDENGVLTSKGKGSAIITAEYNGKKAETSVKVIDKKKNLLPNDGFEIHANGIPQNYKFKVEKGKANISIDAENAYRGNSAVRINNTTDAISKLSTSNRLNLSDGIYSVSVLVKYEDFEGKGLSLNLNQNKSDNIFVDVKSEFLVNDKGEKYQKLEFIYDGIHYLRSIALDLVLEGKGTAIIDELKLVKLSNPKTINLEQNINIDLATENNNFEIKTNILPEGDLIDKRLKWSSLNSDIVTISEDGKAIAKSAGTVDLYAMNIDGTVVGSTKVNVKGKLPNDSIVEVSSIELGKDINIEINEAYKIVPNIEPSNATYKNLKWRSSDESIAKVIDGRVFAKKEGSVNITATANNGVEKNIVVNVVENVTNKYETALEAWTKKTSINMTLDALETEGNLLFEKINKDVNRIYLWDDVKDIRISNNIKIMTDKIKIMALAATDKESNLYMREDIINQAIEATNFISEKCYNESLKYNYRSWDWEIGITKNLSDILSILSPFMSKEEKEIPSKFITTVILPDVKVGRAATDGPTMPMTGANLTDAVKGVLVPHFILQQDNKIEYALDGAMGTLDMVTSGDGFYKDGSFIQHENIAYTGSYGVELLKGISSLMDILSGTEFDINNHSDIDKIYHIVHNSFVPIIYKGALMDMTRGRAIARPGNTDHTNGHVIIDCLILIGNSAPKEQKDKILSIAKRMLNEEKDHLDQITDPARNKRAVDLLNDKSVKPAKQNLFSKEFARMNKTVHTAKDFAFAISKSSKRVANYELLNGENKKGWHTGDGMTYLYNADKNQFTDHFWATVDYFRLPGTTVDTGERASNDSQYGDGEGAPKNSWAGGATLDDRYGISGMNLQAQRKGGTNLTANKSWFMFDNEIIALGSNINSTDGRDIETTFEQRMIEGSNKFTVDGKIKISSLGTKDEIINPKWAHLKGNKKGEDIGYYFPEKQNINILRESRTGDYKEINDGKSGTHTRNYLTMYTNHGKSPKNANYAYSILPGLSQGQVQKYSKDPDFKIIENSENIHAIEEMELDIFAANFFSDGIQSVGKVSVDKKASIMLRENEDFIDVSISDPTQENTGFITVELDCEVEKLITKNDRVTIISISDDKVKFKVNVKDLAGESLTLRFSQDD